TGIGGPRQALRVPNRAGSPAPARDIQTGRSRRTLQPLPDRRIGVPVRRLLASWTGLGLGLGLVLAMGNAADTRDPGPAAHGDGSGRFDRRSQSGTAFR